uniref:LNR domain-containing protein n=1 Tax=Corethron hystrix TaxID=216773 RepID=A0A7S1G246_9STRA|mmetsp:Transcript_7553/g.16366  ORF Transcript_7553/g.16366 Transcript_7553/m.16366 type:complete len:354 (+) Transcript_7553:247-1308(+)|eukprot:CAMPEP_0113301808 /NCGR_PEP_ID=MMETSP0010_2-20120614/2881_1 /TAXON_ID=216773 ORGANISM="Corethron hystrix, Strain 308" /NCGR_SAMPLE_ID=MMETSP0010_2 /ASSEMBLY_ACC=CAM_ASM_000155 /LENGTH=353 /DNA_ID=CAMNT_0000155489 /DNA_START=100 /DNA_END=1161 /DNA_ORIENTATION=+ /assembly_acc=CAM_ASM_000155
MLKSLAIATFFLARAYALRSNSSTFKALLPKARRLDNDDGIDYTYVADYSIKFQGCHHVSQWNNDADGDDNVLIQTKRLVRFRLCPTGSCTNDKTSGCSSGYGDYIVDMDTFLTAYLEDKQQTEEYNCQYAQENTCQCDNDDGDDCLNNCYASKGLDYCIEEDDNAAQVSVYDYAQCAQAEMENRRRLDEDAAYYIGAYCANQGGEIRLGLFLDDTCSEESSTSYATLTGSDLPYSDKSIVSDSCISCTETGQNVDDAADQDQVKELCENLYTYSGKCESYMELDQINEAACSYIEGIKIIRDDGVIRTSSTRKSKGAAVAIGLFATTAILLGAYVYYLRTKLGRAKINLSAD